MAAPGLLAPWRGRVAWLYPTNLVSKPNGALTWATSWARLSHGRRRHNQASVDSTEPVPGKDAVSPRQVPPRARLQIAKARLQIAKGGWPEARVGNAPLG